MKRLLTICLVLLLCASSLDAVPIRSSESNKLGAFSGDGGAAQDDSTKASLDLAHTDLDAILRDYGVQRTTNGSIFYVDAGTAGSTGVSWATAVADIEAATVLCTTDVGDIILVAPGHVEAMTAADDIDIDKNSIKLIGLGTGEARPTLTYTTNGEFVIGADDVEVHGFNFIAGNAVTHAIDVETGAENWVINDCRFAVTTLDTDEFTDCIDTAANSDNGRITNCRVEMGAASASSFIQHVGCDFTEISNNIISGDFSVACIEDKTTASRWMIIDDNILINGTGGTYGLNTVACISIKADTTAIITDNRIFCDMDEAGSIVAAQGLLAKNTYSETAGSGTALEVGKAYVRVSSAASVAASAVDLFDVLGGRIEIISMMGQCTTVMASNPGACSLIIDATTGDQDADFTTAVNIDSLGVGDVVNFAAVTGGEAVLVPTANVNGALPVSWFCPIGMIEQKTASTGTGAITWYMVFRALEDGVTVTVQ